MLAMKKRVLALFAHPDDEAFGPGGTLALWALAGLEIKLVCVTRGEAGNNHTQEATGRVRERELLKSADILGINEVEFLEFQDGEIGNNRMLELIEKFGKEIKRFKPERLITFGLNGVSGHIDHVAVAGAATKAFDKTGVAKSLYYYQESKNISCQMANYFIHFPEGIERDQADEVVDVSSVWEQKLRAMRAHQSQSEDVEAILKMNKNEPREELFLIRSKASSRA